MLAASILDMDFKKSTMAALGGVLLAGAIMLTASLMGLEIFNLAK
jgi:hypothetical protein